MRKILWDIFSEIIEKIAFECENPILVGDLKVADALDKTCHLFFFEAMQNPLNAILGGFLAKHELIAASKEANRLVHQIISVLTQEYQTRMDTKKDTELGVNILDLVIKHNRSVSQEDQMSPLEIVKNIVNF